MVSTTAEQSHQTVFWAWQSTPEILLLSYIWVSVPEIGGPASNDKEEGRNIKFHGLTI